MSIITVTKQDYPILMRKSYELSEGWNTKKICEKRNENGFLIIYSLLTCNPDYQQLKTP